MIAEVRKAWPFLLIGPALILIRIPSADSLLVDIVAYATGLVLLLQFMLLRRSRKTGIASWLLVGCLGWGIATLAWSPEIARGSRFVALAAVAILAFLWARATGPPADHRGVMLAGLVGLGLAVVALLAFPNPAPLGGLNPDRVLGMAVVPLAIAAWYAPHRRWAALLIGALALGTAILSGSRIASFVVGLLLGTRPALRLRVVGRSLLAGLLVGGLFLASFTAGFQERWFETGEGNLLDIVTFQNMDTSGRTDTWSALAERCGPTLLGNGAGASDSWARQINEGFPEPHNEYLRIWCDTGIPGSLLLWGGFVLALWTSLQSQRARPSPLHRAALQGIAAVVVIAATDNPLTTTLPFMVPIAILMGWSVAAANRPLPIRSRRGTMAIGTHD